MGKGTKISIVLPIDGKKVAGGNEKISKKDKIKEKSSSIFKFWKKKNKKRDNESK